MTFKGLFPFLAKVLDDVEADGVELYGTMSMLLHETLEQPHQLFASNSRDLYKCLWIRYGTKRRLPVCNVNLD